MKPAHSAASANALTVASAVVARFRQMESLSLPTPSR